jgi:vacuolar-type H+-ATPase subunit E/Vma4
MTGDRFQIVLWPQDRQQVDGLVADVRRATQERLGRQVEIEVAGEDLAADGGLLVRSADGRQEADQTLGDRLRRLWGRIGDELIRRGGLEQAVAAGGEAQGDRA